MSLVKPSNPELQTDDALAPGLVAYWTYTEGAGLTLHDLVASRNGTIPGTMAWQADGLRTSNTNERITIPYAAALRPTGALTIFAAIDVKSFKTNNAYGLSLGMNNGTREMDFVIGYNAATLKLILTVAGTRHDYSSYAGALTTGRHVFVATRSSGGTVKIYIDGAGPIDSPDPNTHAGAITDTGGGLAIGGLFGNVSQDQLYRGTGLYNRELSVAEVADLSGDGWLRLMGGVAADGGGMMMAAF